jgi:hypothetical protein
MHQYLIRGRIPIFTRGSIQNDWKGIANLIGCLLRICICRRAVRDCFIASCCVIFAIRLCPAGTWLKYKNTLL